MKAKEFDKKFDLGEDITHVLDVENSRRVNHKLKKVDLKIPSWMLELLDKEAKRLGVNRQSIIKLWLAERLEKAHKM